MTDLPIPIREDLRGEQPYGAPQLAVPIILNVNENPYPPSESLVADVTAAIADVVRGLNRYPDREATQLRADLARYLERESGVTVETRQVWAANGSNEIIQEALQAFGGPGRVAMSFTPTYSMYPEYARNTNTGYVAVPRAEDFSIDRDAAREAIATHRPNVILLASPNNPTGTALDLDLISDLHKATDGMVVVDEAYAEFRRAGTESAATLVPSHPRLIVTRTMSKAFAFAGARVGYAIAQIPAIDALRIVRLPYHLSSVTQVVARVALAHVDELQADVARLRTDRDALAEWLLWNGFEAPPSDANFILFGPFADRHAVWQGLVDRGVLIREVGPDGWLRVTIGRPDEITAFKSALLEVVASLSGDHEAPIGPVTRRSDAVETVDDGPTGETTEAEPRTADTRPDATGSAAEAAPGDSGAAPTDPEPAPAAIAPAASHEARPSFDASVVGSLTAPAPDSQGSVEAVGERLQALQGEDLEATVFEGMGVAVDLPELDPVRDVDAGPGAGHDDGDLDDRAAEHDEEIALAVLRDRAEADADQLTGQIVDQENRA